MAVRWIGDAARELGLSPLEAVELLALRKNYPMNGLLDEDRVFLLKRYVQDKKGVEATGRGRSAGGANATQQAKPAPQPKSAPQPKRTEATAVTAPLDMKGDRSEEKTVIMPPPGPNT